MEERIKKFIEDKKGRKRVFTGVSFSAGTFVNTTTEKYISNKLHN